MNQESIVYNKVGEWEDKGKRATLKKDIEKWLAQFEDSEKEEMLVLLANFDYFSANKVGQCVQKLYDKFKSICNSEDIVFTKIEKKQGTSFSNIFYDTFRFVNNLYDYFSDSIDIYNLSNILPQNIVIVDDFFGSGDTFIKFMKSLISKNSSIQCKNIFFVAQQGTFAGVKNIKDFAKEFSLTINIVTLKLTKKAFEQNNIFDCLHADKHRKLYGEICAKKNITDAFGYKEIEALVSFYYNCPNDTLSVFWKDVNNYKALFSRHKRVHTKLSDMQEKLNSRNSLKEKEFFKYDEEDYKYEIFMVYCLAKGKRFTILDACNDFGLTGSQVGDILKYLCLKDYIVYEESELVATDKLREFIYLSKVKDYNKIVNNCKNSDKIETKETKYLPKDFDERFGGYKK